jgi:hypothetical protein
VASEFDPHHALVAAIAGRLRQHYFDRAMGGRLAATLLATSAAGAYAPLDMATEFAAQINADIDTISRTLGVPAGAFVADVIYSTQPLPTRPPPAMTAEMREQVYASLRQQNCLFERIETLPKNIGYIKLNGFGDARACGEMAGRAMASLNDAELLILDLRDNGGGFGETALQIASYLFDRPTYMYDPRPDSPVPTRTASPVPGNKLADKPLYVLTSSRTQSAAEYFVYNMKMLNRATVVGETTAGRQHSGAFFRIDDHFGVGVQEKAPAGNPYAIKGWERIGIEPDVKVPSGEAFDAARMLAGRQQRSGG